MNYLKIALGIFITLAATRFIPHTPNFTSLMALSFYVPAFLGIRYLPIVLISFAITDLIIGFHGVTLFTWGSIILISLLSVYFNKGIISRFSGAFGGACIFFIITNFGVWSLGSYGYSLEGMIACYTLAIPFFANTIISTMIYACLIESVYKFYKTYYKKFLSF